MFILNHPVMTLTLESLFIQMSKMSMCKTYLRLFNFSFLINLPSCRKKARLKVAEVKCFFFIFIIIF